LNYACEVRLVLPPPVGDVEITDFVFALQPLLFINLILLIFVNHTKNLPACITLLVKIDRLQREE
jgi:hypothetical protein